MKAYFLLRQSVPLMYLHLAAIDRKDPPELLDWLQGRKEYCLLDDQEFEQAKNFKGAIVLTSRLRDGEEVGIVFGPRQKWPKEFRRFRKYFDEVANRLEEQTNITEERWLAWVDRPKDLANFALPQMSDRKIRLFAVACCELAAHRMIDPRSQRAVELALRHANGTANDDELSAAADEAYAVTLSIMNQKSRETGGTGQSSPEYGAAALAANATSSFDRTPTTDSPDGWVSMCAGGITVSDFLISHTIQAVDDVKTVTAELTRALHDICGNPFQPVAANSAWQSPGLRALAQRIYDTKSFDRLPELGDALAEAGCNDRAILEHCHLPGPHVRGCWVLDLVLGYVTFVKPIEPRTPWWEMGDDDP